MASPYRVGHLSFEENVTVTRLRFRQWLPDTRNQ